MQADRSRTPEQNLARDLGLLEADLERIVRHERARDRAERLVECLRKTQAALAGWRDDDPDLIECGNLEEFKYGVVDAILAEIDAPIGGA